MATFILKKRYPLVGFLSIVLAMTGITIMVGDSISSGDLFGNLVALIIPISFSVLVMVVRKNANLDLVPAIWYAAFLSVIYFLLMVETYEFSTTILMVFY